MALCWTSGDYLIQIRNVKQLARKINTKKRMDASLDGGWLSWQRASSGKKGRETRDEGKEDDAC